MATVYVGFNSAVSTPWFHNYGYRHILRFPDDMSLGYKKHKRTQTKWFDRKYKELKHNFINAGLDISEFSDMHTIIIAITFGLNEFALLDEYHNRDN